MYPTVSKEQYLKDRMKNYEIWSEGFRATGEQGKALLHSIISANSFVDACNKFANQNKEFKKYYNSTKLSYWGCRLFDNEKDARNNFG